MKIDIVNIPQEGLTKEEDASPKDLDLDTPAIVFKEPVHIKVFVTRITNAVNVDAQVTGKMQLVCGRCLESFESDLERKFKLHYIAEKNQQFIDLDPDIREELILNYPLNPACKSDCKGLCYKCGANLNVGKCNC
jgi:uncharacterized protein